MDQSHETVTECRFRRALGVAFLVFICYDAITTVPELIRPTFSLGFQAAFLKLSIGLLPGAAIAWLVTSLFRRRVSSSLVLSVRSWQLYGGPFLLFIVWSHVIAQMAEHCTLMPAPHLADCFAGIYEIQWVMAGAIYGMLVWAFFWAFLLERQHKRPFVLTIRSKTPQLFHGWSAMELAMVVGFVVFVGYVFYEIFQLK